jgi:hypothetical protein
VSLSVPGRVCNSSLILLVMSIAVSLSTLKDLRALFLKADTTYSPKYTLQLRYTPILVKFACNDEKLVVCQINGLISVFDTRSLQEAATSVRLFLMYSVLI